MKKCFRKILVMTKKYDDDFKNSAKCCICDNFYSESDVTPRYCCDITGKYRGSAHKDCNSKVKLNHKIHIVSHNLNY